MSFIKINNDNEYKNLIQKPQLTVVILMNKGCGWSQYMKVYKIFIFYL